jgi:hypothetical protein
VGTRHASVVHRDICLPVVALASAWASRERDADLWRRWAAAVFQSGEMIPKLAFQSAPEAPTIWRLPKADAGDIAGTGTSRLSIERRLEVAGA